MGSNQAAQGSIMLGLENFQRQRLNSLSRNLLHSLTVLKMVSFPDIKSKMAYFFVFFVLLND